MTTKCEITGLAFDSVEYGDAVERAENILLGSTASDDDDHAAFKLLMSYLRRLENEIAKLISNRV